MTLMIIPIGPIFSVLMLRNFCKNSTVPERRWGNEPTDEEKPLVQKMKDNYSKTEKWCKICY